MSKIPQEAIEAMRGKRNELIAKPLDRIYGDLIEAALPSLSADAARAQGAEVAVKPLVWKKGYCDEVVESKNTSFGGSYQIRALHGEIWLDWPPGSATRFTTEQEAIAAAQADYEQRVRSALTTPPAPQPTDREKVLEERLQAIIDWADLAMKNADEFDSHGVRNLDGPVFDAARSALAGGEA